MENGKWKIENGKLLPKLPIAPILPEAPEEKSRLSNK
jgi:hypothetical protein